jgi:transposase-like protein
LVAVIVCCDGLKGLPDAIRVTWPQATVQTCVVHLLRNSLRYASKAARADDHKATAHDLRGAGRRCCRGAVRRLLARVEAVLSGDDRQLGGKLEQVVPFLEFPIELRKIVYTTNAIESLSARFRRAVRHPTSARRRLIRDLPA